MKKYDTLVIGHISLDEIVLHTGEISHPAGGAVLFSSYSAMTGGNKVGVVTKVSKENEYLLDDLNVPKEDLYYIESEKTTSIRSEFVAADQEIRISTALSVADPFTLEDIPEVESEIYHLAGLMLGDFDDELMEVLSKKGKLAVDTQAFLRVNVDGDMVFKDWEEKRKYIPYIHFLKTDAAEAEILTGCADREEAAKILFEWGAKEIMITHNSEIMVYNETGVHTVPLKNTSSVGRSGRGDTGFSAYITERARKDSYEALLYATAIVSMKMGDPGPYKGTREDVERFIKENY